MATTSKTEILERWFGHGEFRPGQEAVIDVLLGGRNALALFPTGGGKSLCYQLPALLFDGLTLVVSPLIALMKDQVETLQSKEIEAARLDSTLEPSEINRIYDAMEDGSLKLLYVAPERLANEGFLRRLRRTPIEMMAVDEAHCISEWGHNFRPDYLKLAALAKDLKIPRILALTATATPKVAEQIRERFSIAETDHIQTGFSRPNLTFEVHPCSESERDEKLIERIKEHPPGPSVIYVTLQQTAERVAGTLNQAGLDARAYHAGMRDDHRAEVQEKFMDNEINIVVATIAFGMGVDKADIRHVYHYNLPKSLENYVQESGRAGRDGETATCEIFACSDDLTVLENKQALAKNIFMFGQVMEGTQFYGLFGMILSLYRQNKFPGIGQMFRYTLRDESNHINVFLNLLNSLVMENPEIMTPEFKEDLRQTMAEGVRLEKEFIRDCLPVASVGLSVAEFEQYIDYISDRRLVNCHLEPLAGGNVENPFPWLSEAIDLKKEQNFFEGKVTEYQKASALEDSGYTDDDL